MDIDDPAAVRWLAACIWPEHHIRRERFARALDIARVHRPVVRAGDMVDAFGDVLSTVPQDAAVCVYHSSSVNYIPMERRRQLVGLISDAAHSRQLVWVSAEGPRVLPDMPVPTPTPAGAVSVFATTFHPMQSRFVAWADVFGEWIDFPTTGGPTRTARP